MRYSTSLILIGISLILFSMILAMQVGIWKYYIWSGFWSYSYPELMSLFESVYFFGYNLGIIGILLGLVSLFVNSFTEE